MRLAADEARRRLAAVRVARLATVSPEGRPHIVPVTFVVDGEAVYTAVDAKPKSTRDLQRLRNIMAEPAVALLADHYEEDWSLLWWARADGEASLLTSEASMAWPLELLADRYRQYAAHPPDGPVIAIAVTRWSGWSAS